MQQGKGERYEKKDTQYADSGSRSNRSDDWLRR